MRSPFWRLIVWLAPHMRAFGLMALAILVPFGGVAVARGDWVLVAFALPGSVMAIDSVIRPSPHLARLRRRGRVT